MKQILDIDPKILAYDLHPDYLSTRYALEQEGMDKIAVQHHHAHIVSCMTEKGLDGPVLGLSFDGTGYGTDGSIWGGEVLIAEPHHFLRAAYLTPVAMPGGDRAIKEPWRMAVSYLYHVFGEAFCDLELPLLRTIEGDRIRVVQTMISKNVNTPPTSSLGRLFDGIAAIVGIRNQVAYEGQGAMELEMAIREETDRTYDYDWKKEKEAYRILIHPIIGGVVRDMERGLQVAAISQKFHTTLIRLFSDLCGRIRQETGLDRVVLSGGVFQNVVLLSGLSWALKAAGFQVFSHGIVPTNDGGISLGQALVAAAVAAS